MTAAVFRRHSAQRHMKVLAHFRIVDDEAKARAVARLIKGSTPDFDFFFLVVLSVVMATVGIVIDSPTVVIGSMLIAPILFPVLSLALGVVLGDYKVFYRALTTLGLATGLSVLLAFVVVLLVPGEVAMTAELSSRTEPTLAYLAIAMVSGLAVSYALVQPGLSETLPGIAISVALLPPLSASGALAAMGEWSASVGAFALFVVNVLGILLATVISFMLMNLAASRHAAVAVVKKEEKRIAEEEEAMRKIYRTREASADRAVR